MRRSCRRCAAAVAGVAAILAWVVSSDALRGETPTPALDGARPQPSLRWVEASGRARAFVEVNSLSSDAIRKVADRNLPLSQWQQMFPVYAATGVLNVDINLPAMLGEYRVGPDFIRFEPRYPLEPGVTYKAVFYPGRLVAQGGGSEEFITAVFKMPARKRTAPTIVSAIYPTADVLPENLLKFYVHFSAAMRRGNVYSHIQLRNARGESIELPFLELDEELWDREMKRLTLFIDPGRIKRGVRPLEEVGPSLEAGGEYTLVIMQTLQDSTGHGLEQAHEKKFKVASPERDPLDPHRWKIDPPKSGTRDPLRVTFSKPMDHALAQRCIFVTTRSGERVPGEVALTNHERDWLFTPGQPWDGGGHELTVETTIEDLAGNNVGKPFEVDLVTPRPQRPAEPTVRVPFEVSSPE